MMEFLSFMWPWLVALVAIFAADLIKTTAYDKGYKAAHKEIDQQAFLKAYREMCKQRYGI